MRLRSALILAALTLASCLGAGRLLAQERPTPLDPSQIEGRITALEAANTANGVDAPRTQAIAAYKEAVTLAGELEVAATLGNAFVDRTNRVADDLAALKARATELDASEQPPSDSGDTGLEEATRVLETLRPKLESARAAFEAHNTEEELRRQRLSQLPEIISRAKSELAALAIPPVPLASAPPQAEADFQLQVLRTALLEQQLKTREAELQFYKDSAELFAAEGTAANQRLVGLERSVEAWQQVLDRRRLASTSAAAKRAEQDVERYADNPAARAIAAENAELALERGGRDGLSQKLAAANNLLSQLQIQQDWISKQYTAAKRRVELLEGADLKLDATTGQLLRQQRQKLTDTERLREQLREVIRQSAQAQIDLIRYEDRQAALAESPKPDQSTEPELAQLHAARGQQLSSLISDSRIYTNKLSDAVTMLRNIFEETESFSQFIDERLLWIPSTHPINLTEPQSEATSIQEMFTGGNLESLAADMRAALPVWLLAGVTLAFLVIRRKGFHSALVAAGEIAQKRNCTSFVPTARAIAYTLLLVAPVPIAAWFVYSRSGDMTPGVREGLRHLSAFLSGSLILKWIAHPNGLMVDHFRLSPERANLIRAHLRWFIPLMAPYLFFAVALPLDGATSSSGRLFFIGALVVLSLFCCLLFRPSKRLILWHRKAPNKLSRTCFALGIAAPLALILGAAAGYFASVQELRLQCMMSVGLILAGLLVAAILHRLILVSRRRLAIQQALERRAAAIAFEQESEQSTKKSSSSPRIASQDEFQAAALSMVEVEEQTSRLLRATTITLLAFGLWGIWKPTIPALSALDRVTLWEEKLAVSSPATGTAATPTAASGATSKATPTAGSFPDATGTLVNTSQDGEEAAGARVTLQDLAVSLIALLLTIVASNNIPGLLELTLLRRLRLAPGSSFAFTTTIRYFIVVTGLIIALGMIGITWGKVQWIAAAITLGIGFGLQEIFANFVAGLIILFERPIRLGDVVTVGDVSGKVSQIRIRATTIRQFNSRELIVPNKEFITGKLVNWTLSDSIQRLEIMVGIAYGSDTKLATEILMSAAAKNGRILEEPAPDVLFDDFADSSLLFQLRAHVGNVDDLIPARTELRFAIDQGFREAGIEIAFPQTDVHIRSLPESSAPAGDAVPL